MRANLRVLFAVLMLASISGCTTSSKVYDQTGQEALLIECGAAVSFSVCHKRALQECPQGYVLTVRTSFSKRLAELPPEHRLGFDRHSRQLSV